MLDVTTSEVYNEVDKMKVKLYVEWIDSHFKIILLSSSMEVLIGEMTAEDIKYYSDELSKSSDDYLKDIKNAFLGKDTKVQFFLRNDTFTWKRRMWTLGKIRLQPILELKSLACMFGEVLAHHAVTQEKLIQVGVENDSLKRCNQKLTADIQEMIRVKDSMEKQLYKKFLLILNGKKEKIRELKSILNSGIKEDKSVFEERTDESDISDTEQKQLVKNDSVKSEKRKLLCDIAQSNVSKLKKTTMITRSNDKSDSSPRASTSKDSVNENVHTTMPVLSDSSETDYELQLRDSDDADTPKKGTQRLSFTEELEDDLFAQT